MTSPTVSSYNKTFHYLALMFMIHLQTRTQNRGDSTKGTLLYTQWVWGQAFLISAHFQQQKVKESVCIDTYIQIVSVTHGSSKHSSLDRKLQMQNGLCYSKFLTDCNNNPLAETATGSDSESTFKKGMHSNNLIFLFQYGPY